MGTLNAQRQTIPVWGILSAALTPLALLFAHLVTLIVEGMWGSPHTQSYAVTRGSALDTAILGADRAALLFAWAVIAFGVIAGVVASAKRLRPRWLPVVGVASTVCIMGLFIYLAGPD